MQHDVKVLDGVDALQRPPVLEPDNLRLGSAVPPTIQQPALPCLRRRAP